MASPPIKPLDGHGGYLRWKESLLLRAHTLGIAHVLSEARPPAGDGDDDEAAAKKWARDDALCRGHILATLSDRLLPDYARFATAADLWRALARTYDVEMTFASHDRFREFSFEESTGDVFLEQLAHVEALGAAAGLGDDWVAACLRGKLPLVVSMGVITRSGPGGNKRGMGVVWEVAQTLVSTGADLWGTASSSEDQENGYPDCPMPEQNTASWKRGERGHVISRNYGRRA